MNQTAALMLRASSIAPAARDWVAESHSARVLHTFDRSCNLINDHGRILSLVSEDIGNGPFSAVVPGMNCATPHADSRVELRHDGIWIDGAGLDLLSAPVWDPCPDWAALHAFRTILRRRISAFSRKAPYTLPGPRRSRASLPALWQERIDEALRRAAHDLGLSINVLDGQGTWRAARHLAGLGEGLTPAGDDILMGAIHAAWVIHIPETARTIAAAILNAARGKTTALSFAWLEAAARGEAAIRWHRFLRALHLRESAEIEASAGSILATGHTSGRAALHGFLHTLLRGPT